jgi:hypothetical protein
MSLAIGELRPLQAMAASILFRKRRLMLCLPRQKGGKTELGVRLMQDLCFKPFTSSALFLAKSRPAARKAVREKFLRLFDPSIFSVNTEIVYNKSYKTSQCFIDSVDKDPDRIRGGTYALIHWSEVAFSKIEGDHSIKDVFDKVINPTLTETNGYALLESTNNGKNGWFDLWNMAPEFGFATLRVSLSDMVYLGLCPRDEYDRIKATTQPDVFLQEYECEWVTFTGKTYPEFIPGRHILPDMEGPKDWQRTVIGIDWGYTPSATCALFAYVENGAVHVYDEHYQKEEMPIKTAEAINALMARWKVQQYSAAADHEQDRIDELNLRGITCGKAKKVDVLGNRVQIKELFFLNKLYIHPRCVNLIRDLEAAIWHPKKSDKGEIDDSQCTWGHFDAEAALRYLIREFGDFEEEKPLENPFAATDQTSAAEWAMQAQKRLGEWQP